MVRSISPFGAFHSSLPVFESLRVANEIRSAPQLFNFVCFLPILKDLTLLSCKIGDIDDDVNTTFRPSTVPPLSGDLNVCLTHGMEPVARQLWKLPNDVRFRKLSLTLFVDDDLWCTAAMVEECSDTLEVIEIRCPNQGEFNPSSFFHGPVIGLHRYLR